MLSTSYVTSQNNVQQLGVLSRISKEQGSSNCLETVVSAGRRIASGPSLEFRGADLFLCATLPQGPLGCRWVVGYVGGELPFSLFALRPPPHETVIYPATLIINYFSLQIWRNPFLN